MKVTHKSESMLIQNLRFIATPQGKPGTDQDHLLNWRNPMSDDKNRNRLQTKNSRRYTILHKLRKHRHCILH